MALTKAQTTELAYKLREIEIPSRVVMFNELIPWLRKVSPRYAIVDFYEIVFYHGQEPHQRWDNYEGRVTYVE